MSDLSLCFSTPFYRPPYGISGLGLLLGDIEITGEIFFPGSGKTYETTHTKEMDGTTHTYTDNMSWTGGSARITAKLFSAEVGVMVGNPKMVQESIASTTEVEYSHGTGTGVGHTYELDYEATEEPFGSFVPYSYTSVARVLVGERGIYVDAEKCTPSSIFLGFWALGITLSPQNWEPFVVGRSTPSVELPPMPMVRLETTSKSYPVIGVRNRPEGWRGSKAPPQIVRPIIA